MPQPPLELLRCPDCRAALRPREDAEGARCTSCPRAFRQERGVLDLVSSSVQPLTHQTVTQFGASWQIHDHLADYQEKQFLDWISPMEPGDFEGKDVLEAGCGKGRHSRLLERFHPRRLLSVDLSDAVLLAAHNTQETPNVFCLRADLLDLPVADGAMDVVFCLGVLHHLEDPEAGLKELWRALKSGGTLCLWVYGREGNGWIVHLVDPVRKGITSKIPTRWLRPLLWPVSLALFLAIKVLYAPATRHGRRTVSWLPYSSYLGYISSFPFREIEHIVLDHLCPPVAFYLSKETLAKWFSGLDPQTIRFRWHNRNSWTVVAQKK
jgi:SAM-dependent methyltransferase